MDYRALSKKMMHILLLCFMLALPIGILLDVFIKGMVNYFGVVLSIFMFWYVPKYNPIFLGIIEKYKDK
ncbi:hypothetical protein COO16_04025 [Bacillus pseudomycoides]|uniref:hypothetical protein n=1 Tax=Bacillus pseudomycoides TaxID=64104 RepID=UPI000BEC415B|nr:hypothetical protein [Bacillus pseudomycoides]PDY14139.1 hypothetical protein COO16_04025 [Bacillus pseudomycoides]